MGLCRVRQQHCHTSSTAEACHLRTVTEGFVIETHQRVQYSCTRLTCTDKQTCKHILIYIFFCCFFFCENLISALSHLPVTSLLHIPKTHRKHNNPHPHTHVDTHTQHTVLSFLDVSVHDSLAANPSVGWMSVSSPFIIRLIRHPRHCFYIRQQSH